MFIACAIWGLMAPLGKDAMTHGLTGMEMVTFRVCGGATCFWLLSFVQRACGHTAPRLPRRDLMMFAAAAVFGIVLNQCTYTVGLSITSPVNASIMTTTMPIITMVLAAIFLAEPITWMKAAGVALGLSGALLLILYSSHGEGEGVLLGDILCICAQCSYAIYLTIFRDTIRKYDVVTTMKWMMLAAALLVTPFTLTDVASIAWANVPAKTWSETAFVVVGGTFIAYLCCVKAQQILRPTLIAMYNYVQPVIACIATVAIGIGTFGLGQAASAALVFTGVWLVNKSKAAEKKLNN